MALLFVEHSPLPGIVLVAIFGTMHTVTFTETRCTFSNVRPASISMLLSSSCRAVSCSNHSAACIVCCYWAGDIAAFGSDLGVRQSVSLSTRLDWCLGDAQDWVEQEIGTEEKDQEAALLTGSSEAGLWAAEDSKSPGTADSTVVVDKGVDPSSMGDARAGGGGRVVDGQQESTKGREQTANQRRRWILKPSTLNKGVGLTLGNDFETLRDAIHSSPDIREWVLQEYVERPLLAEGRKFHVRAYALAGMHAKGDFLRCCLFCFVSVNRT